MSKRNSARLPVKTSTPVATSTASNAETNSTSSTPTFLHTHLRVFTADIETAIWFAKTNQNAHNFLTEIFAEVLSNKPGELRTQRILLLRNGNEGPVLQCVYYETTHPLPPVEIGDTVRCVGHFIGETLQFRMEKVTIVNDPAAYRSFIERLMAISSFAMRQP